MDIFDRFVAGIAAQGLTQEAAFAKYATSPPGQLSETQVSELPGGE